MPVIDDALEASSNANSGAAVPPPAAAPAAGAAPAAASASPDTSESAAQGDRAFFQPGTAPQGRQHTLPVKVLSGILQALGGGETVSYERDPETGKMIATRAKIGNGQAAKRVIAGAMAGAASGLGVEGGPGHEGRAVAAGFGTVTKALQHQDVRKRSQANEDYDEQQKALVRKADLAHKAQEVAASTWRMKREGIAQDQQMISNYAAAGQRLAEAGGEQLRTFESAADFFAAEPSLKDQVAQGMPHGIIQPVMSPDGHVTAYAMPLGWENQRTTEATEIQRYVGVDKAGKPVYEKETYPAGTKNGDLKHVVDDNYSRRAKDLEKVYQQEQTTQRERETRASTERVAQIAAGGRKERQDQARSDKSYQYNSGQLDKLRTPIDQISARLGRLNDSINEHTPQADALIAPELLTVLAGGAGSGLRMNEAEIARIIGGRSKWEGLKAALNQWSTDPRKANSITDEQRQQMKSLVDVVGKKVQAKQAALDRARQTLINSDDPDAHRKAYAAAQNRLTIIDRGGALEDGFVRIVDSQGFAHDIPEDKVNEAKKRDPKLQVIQ